jgi:uncharacterized protein YcnI
MSSRTTSTRPSRSTARRTGLVAGAAVVASLALSGTAQAHVEVEPAHVPGGGEAVIAFRVPNESDSTNTVSLRVLMPKNKPIGEVQTTAMPGWTVVTKTRTLAQPIEVEGEKLDSVVSQVTWRASGDGIVPGQYQDFDLSLATLPDSGKLVFTAVQTYSDGSTVNWNEVSADDSVEPEHPAPTLTLTPAVGEGAAASTPDTAAATAGGAGATDQATTPAAETGSDSDSVWPLLLSGGALVVSVLTALMVWRRGRPAPAVLDARSRDLENSSV